MLKFFNNGAPQITMEHSTEHSNQQVVCMQEVAYA